MSVSRQTQYSLATQVTFSEDYRVVHLSGRERCRCNQDAAIILAIVSHLKQGISARSVSRLLNVQGFTGPDGLDFSEYLARILEYLAHIGILAKTSQVPE